MHLCFACESENMRSASLEDHLTRIAHEYKNQEESRQNLKKKTCSNCNDKNDEGGGCCVRRRNAFCGFQLSSESYTISTERNRKQNNFLATYTTKLVGNPII